MMLDIFPISAAQQTVQVPYKTQLLFIQFEATGKQTNVNTVFLRYGNP